jgi:D-proline reductase (dithiol) PrdB
VGLIQREIEKAGIPSIGISIERSYSEKVKPPRSIFLRWPFGHPFGQAFNRAQQRVVLAEALRALFTIKEPGTILDMHYRFKNTHYDDVDISAIFRRESS